MLVSRLFILVFFILGFAFGGIAQNIILEKRGETQKIGTSVYFIEDKTNQLTIQEISSPTFADKFAESDKEMLDFAFTTSTYWLRLTISNPEQLKGQLLVIPNPDLDYASFFSQDTLQNWNETAYGDMLPYEKRTFKHRYIVFSLNNTPATPTTYYLKFYGASPVIIPLEIIDIQHFYIQDVNTQFFYGIFCGILLLIILNNGINFLILRENTYLLYSVYVLITLLVVFSTSGHLSELLFHQHGGWKNEVYFILILSVVVSSSLFAISFLNLPTNAPLMYKINLGLFAFDFCLIVSHFFLPYQNVFLILTLRATIPFPILFISSYIVWRKGNGYIVYYFVGYIIYFLGILAQVSAMYESAGSDFARLHGVEAGILAEIIFISIAVNVKYYEERKKAQLAKIQAQEEIIQVNEKANKFLETKISERTKQLQEQSEEIAVQNEELQQSREQISSQRDILEEQNKQLTVYTESLEKLVSERTQQLQETNQELINYNGQLEQFAFITAHNLRAPIARLLGLTNIFDTENLANEFNATVIDKIHITSENLDTVIKDLNLILEIKKGYREKESINLPEKLSKVLQILEMPIKESQAEIIADFGEISEVIAIGAYIDSILYNLLSNAIKYKAMERKPIIHIRTFIENKNLICLSITDNGLGIDLDNYGEKIFGMYKRFHLHVDGKGLGLYLTKTQVEAMGGEIKIESKLNEGTTFKILLKN